MEFPEIVAPSADRLVPLHRYKTGDLCAYLKTEALAIVPVPIN
jgi:hypothetical protein